jgi:hypothetical protein
LILKNAGEHQINYHECDEERFVEAPRFRGGHNSGQ